MSELESEIKQLLDVEEMVRGLRQKKEGELRRQFFEEESRAKGCQIV